MLEEIKRFLEKKPNKKAREISKYIGQNRKVVNACLYSNPDYFIKDDKHCWSLIPTSELVVEFPADQWVDCDSFETALKRAGSPLDSDCQTVVFNIPQNCKILLDAAARFLALCNQIINEEKNVKIDFSQCKTTLSYFDRNGFLEQLNNRIEILPMRPKTSKASKYKGNNKGVVEFGVIDPAALNKDLINHLTDSFVAQSSNDYEGAASTVFGELIGNVIEHSEAEIPGFAALQKYEGKRKHIQTVISDSGLGISETLKPSLKDNYPILYKLNNTDDFELQLVLAVLTKGEISRFGSGRGLGFKSSREQATKFNARLSVRQENFSLNIEYEDGDPKKIIKQVDLATIRGTHLCFDFYVDKSR